MRLNKLAVTLLAFLLFALGLLLNTPVALSADARTIYVDNTLSGNCTANNYNIASRSCAGSDGLAYSTFASAISAMQPGDPVAIRGGTYRTNLVVNKSGAASAHLQFMAHAGEKGVIDLADVNNDLPGQDQADEMNLTQVFLLQK